MAALILQLADELTPDEVGAIRDQLTSQLPGKVVWAAATVMSFDVAEHEGWASVDCRCPHGPVVAHCACCNGDVCTDDRHAPR